MLLLLAACISTLSGLDAFLAPRAMLSSRSKSSESAFEASHHRKQLFSPPRHNSPPLVTLKSNSKTTTALHFSLSDISSLLTISTNDHGSLLQAYQHLLQLHPLTTKAVTSGILAGAGDAIAQRSSAEPYDKKRGLAFVSFGALYTGLFQHYWFQYLNDHVLTWGSQAGLWPATASLGSIPVHDLYKNSEWWMYFDIMDAFQDGAPSDNILAICKLVVNQFGMIPIVYLPLYFALTGALSDLSLEESWERMKSLYFGILKRNYVYWLPVQFIQFSLIPTEFQIPYVSAMSLIWTCILSSVSASAATAEEAPISTAQAYQQPQDPQSLLDRVVTATSPDADMNFNNDDVSLQDVEDALFPNPEGVRAAAAGGAVSLLAAAAEDATLGTAVAGVIGSEVGAGVAAVAVAGAGVGLLASKVMEEVNSRNDDFSSPDDANEIDETTILPDATRWMNQTSSSTT